MDTPLSLPPLPHAAAGDTESLELGRFDVYTRLLKDRIVFLGTDVNDDVANFIIAQMLFLEAQEQVVTAMLQTQQEQHVPIVDL